MFSTASSSVQAAVLAWCILSSCAAPQHYFYLAAPQQHYGQYGAASNMVAPVSYNAATGYNTGYNPAISYTPVGYNPNPAINYNPNYSPVSYNPAVNYNPQSSVPQQIPQQVPHQFYYNNHPLLRQPQFVFLYPAGHGQVPGVAHGAVPNSPPVPPPRDETGDAETIGTESSAEREPLSPGVAMSGPEAGKRVMPEKHVAPVFRVPEKHEAQIQRTYKVKSTIPVDLNIEPVPKPVDVMPVKSESSAVPAVKTQRPVVVQEESEAPVQAEEKHEVKRHNVLQSRVGNPAQADARRSAEAEERELRAESRGWRRRLAPGVQSLYIDADDDDDEDDKKKPGKEEGDSVVVGGSDAPAGPSVASVKPAAIALAGPGGVASASPVGTAVVGPGGLAVAAPSATAVAGPSGGVPPGALGSGAASARSNLRLHQILEALYAAPARRAALRTGPSAYSSFDQSDDYDQ